MIAELTNRDRAAMKVVELAKALVLADNHFLSAAVGRLQLRPGRFLMPMATNGFELGIDSAMVCDMFLNSKEPPKHDFLHTVLHCVFLHPYVGPAIDRRLWDVACDIAVEGLVVEVCGERGGNRGRRIGAALKRVKDATGPHMSAEKVYCELRNGKWIDSVSDWELLFAADDHSPWYMRGEASGENGASDGVVEDNRKSGYGRQGEGEAGGRPSSSSDGGAKGARELQGGPDQATGDGGIGKSSGSDSVRNKSAPDAGQGYLPGNSQKLEVSNDWGAGLREVARPNRTAEMEDWRRVAKSLAINLQTYSKGRGKSLGGFVGELEEASHSRVDYADFLRQFAVPGEVLKVSEDEFDYVFYTYGLRLYGNLPLIEPLEYREEKRVREFVIVIDTSGSVWNNVVRRFVDTTFNILKSTEAFFERVHVRIIQCDAAVRADDTITNLAELETWGHTMRLFGCGGTDFRPAFAYVDKLVEDDEFENLGGLIYFTDGWGTYPEWIPDYKTAFVFYDDGYRQDIVPPWAAQIVLDDTVIDGYGRKG